MKQATPLNGPGEARPKAKGRATTGASAPPGPAPRPPGPPCRPGPVPVGPTARDTARAPSSGDLWRGDGAATASTPAATTAACSGGASTGGGDGDGSAVSALRAGAR